MIEEIMLKMKNIDYGWKDKNNEFHFNVNDEFSKEYVLQSPLEVIENKIGVCWDQVELERYLFEHYNIEIETYFIVHYDNDKCPTHTFLIFKNSNKYYWFEHSWEKFRGIWTYDSKLNALMDIKEKFIKYELKNNYNPMNLCIYLYDRPKYGISCLEFYNHCENGKSIIL